jgi:putative FmdB family regulatory protein
MAFFGSFFHSIAMPIYAYKCGSCGHAKDVLQKMSDDPLTDCPACGQSAFSKQLTAPGFQLKGTGWYATDFKSGGNAATATATDDTPATSDASTATPASSDGTSSTASTTTTTPTTTATNSASGSCGTSCAGH